MTALPKYSLALLLTLLATAPFAPDAAAWNRLWKNKWIQETDSRTYYVSPQGSDDNPGSRELPFATLERARTVIRVQKATRCYPTGGLAVILMPGRHLRRTPFTLTAQDSAPPDCQIVWKAHPDAEICGGTTIPWTDFTPLADDATSQRLPAELHPLLRQIDLARLAIPLPPEYPARFRGAPPWPKLYRNRQPLPQAGWPDREWAVSGELLNCAGGQATLRYNHSRMTRWQPEDGIWLHGFWGQEWVDESIALHSTNSENQTFTLQECGPFLPVLPQATQDGFRFRAVNVLEELDQPGEWFIDRKQERLLFYPPDRDNQLARQDYFLATVATPLWVMDGADNLILSDLNFFGTRGNALEINGNGNIVSHCSLRGIGGTAISVSGNGNQILGCRIDTCGGNGITLTGGDRNALQPAENMASNNDISRIGRSQLGYSAAIHLAGMANAAIRNVISDLPHAGISFNGNEHRIEMNDISQVCREIMDAGMIQAGRDWSFRRNSIKNNILRHSQGFRDSATAILLDDCLSETIVDENIICAVPTAIRIGGGRDNLLTDNLILDCPVGIALDARGEQLIRWNAHADDPWNLPAKLNQVPYQELKWALHYPKLEKILGEEPARPLRNQATGNILAGCKTAWLIPPELIPLFSRESNAEIPSITPMMAPLKPDFNLPPTTSWNSLLPGFPTLRQLSGVR